MSGYTSIDNQKVAGSVPAAAPVRNLPSCSASFGFSDTYRSIDRSIDLTSPSRHPSLFVDLIVRIFLL